MYWVKVDIEIPDNDFITQIKVNNKKLCLIKYQEEIYATQPTCPHAGGILSGGWCREGNLICPIHRYEYNLNTGRGAKGQGDYIRVYPIELRSDGLFIGFKESLWQRFFKKDKE
jgi:nitrite reductase/ring-hydroxylating ferredoxin subunit